MREVTRVNVARLALAGAAAAVVHFLATGLVNGLILSAELQMWLNGLQGLLHPPAWAAAMCLWALMSLTYGVIGVWLYANIKPNYVAGSNAVLLASLSLWMVSKLAVAFDLIALGIMPLRIITGQAIGGLIAIVLGVLVGAWVYKE